MDPRKEKRVTTSRRLSRRQKDIRSITQERETSFSSATAFSHCWLVSHSSTRRVPTRNIAEMHVLRAATFARAGALLVLAFAGTASSSAGEGASANQLRVASLPHPQPQLGPEVAHTTSLVFSVEDSPPNPRGPITCYRIPMVVSTSNGTLVAFSEARIGHPVIPGGNGSDFKPSCDDCTVNGIAQRRSTDGGKSWGAVTWAVSDVSILQRSP